MKQVFNSGQVTLNHKKLSNLLGARYSFIDCGLNFGIDTWIFKGFDICGPKEGRWVGVFGLELRA